MSYYETVTIRGFEFTLTIDGVIVPSHKYSEGDDRKLANALAVANQFYRATRESYHELSYQSIGEPDAATLARVASRLNLDRIQQLLKQLEPLSDRKLSSAVKCRSYIYKFIEVLQQQAARKTKPQRNTPTNKNGFVYLLRSISGYWKIGRATDPSDRLRTFEVKLPFEVQYEHVIPTNNMVEAEKLLHDRFATKRINGEWFDLTPEDLQFIKSIERLEI